MANILNIGSSALLAYQRALSVTGHNIANANTPGFNRQVAHLGASLPQYAGYGWIGSGVDTQSIERMYSGYLDSQVRGHTSSASQYETFQVFASRLDNTLADPDAGMNTGLQNFVNSVHDVADDPTSPAAREVLLSEGQLIVDRFHSLANYLDDLSTQANTQVETGIEEINRLTSGIATINQRIIIDLNSNGAPPNDLMDQRDNMVRELSQYVSVKTVMQDDGAMNVFVGQGQGLVVGANATQLASVNLQGLDPKVGVGMVTSTGSVMDITRQMTGGRLSGLMDFRDQMLDGAMNDLGRMAIGMADLFNQQHRNGMDLNGALGTDFFSLGSPGSTPLGTTAGTLGMAFDDVANLTGSDYQLDFNGTWSLTRSDTGQTVAMTGTGTVADPFIVDGMQIVVPAGAVAGDSWLLQPTRQAAGELERAIQTIDQIAAAFPMLGQASSANLGSGQISAGTVSDINNPAFQTTAGQLTPPILIRFTGPNSYDIYDNTVAGAPVLMEAGIAYDPATGGEVFPTPGAYDPGYRMKLSGAPQAGDEFSVSYNASGLGDNRNALELAALFEQNQLGGGTESFADVYAALIADVGTDTRQAELNGQTHATLLDQAMSSQSALSGVNLDEEAANLVKYQQAYQAAAQVVAAANELFDVLLSATRR